MRALTVLAFVMGLTLMTSDIKGEEDPKSAPPLGAVVLFDGKDLSQWVVARTKEEKPAAWKVADGYMEVARGDIMTKQKFGPDFELHVEFWLPNMPDAKGQGRANSGVYLQGRYEIQVLDSYMNDTYPGGSVGALYNVVSPGKAAQEKAVKPPEQWNSYDITFQSPRVGPDGKVTQKGKITVKLNGIALIDNAEFDKTTGGALDDKLGEPGPILLQDHGNKVRFRNIWIRPLK